MFSEVEHGAQAFGVESGREPSERGVIRITGTLMFSMVYKIIMCFTYMASHDRYLN